MILREQVPLSSLTSLKTGGNARYVIDASTSEELREALSFARKHELPWYVLGGGSNVLADDEGYPGVIIRPRLHASSYNGERMVVGAGVEWEVFVRRVAEQTLWGVENLAGIPGLVGGAPIQNIGAYGVEIKDSIEFVEVLSSVDGRVFQLSRDACAFSYRDSIFKRDPSLIVTAVGFVFSKTPSPRLSYADIQRAQEDGADLSTPSAIGDVVRGVRARKFPDLRMHGTAGSFFKNPVISEGAFALLAQKYPELPRYSSMDGVKIPLAFVLDRVLSLRGFRMGHAWLYDKQPLVLVLDEGGTASDVEALATSVVQKVKEETGIMIEREVQSLIIK